MNCYIEVGTLKSVMLFKYAYEYIMLDKNTYIYIIQIKLILSNIKNVIFTNNKKRLVSQETNASNICYFQKLVKSHDV